MSNKSKEYCSKQFLGSCEYLKEEKDRFEALLKVTSSKRAMRNEQLARETNKQKKLIEKQEKDLHEQRLQLNGCESFFDMLWRDYDLSKLFRTDLAQIRCKLCNITDCSTRNDREECLRMELLSPVFS